MPKIDKMRGFKAAMPTVKSRAKPGKMPTVKSKPLPGTRVKAGGLPIQRSPWRK